jgi:DNA-binding MarR family transcriptional regulator
MMALCPICALFTLAGGTFGQDMAAHGMPGHAQAFDKHANYNAGMNAPVQKNRIHVDSQPGHLIRRLHQIAVGLFVQETESLGVTPMQYAALQTVQQAPGMDQRTLARAIALDASTTGGVVDRLEARQLIERRTSPSDRRVRLLQITPQGDALLDTITPLMLQAQQRILAPLSPDQREAFMEMLGILIDSNSDHSRAPAGPRRT